MYKHYYSFLLAFGVLLLAGGICFFLRPEKSQIDLYKDDVYRYCAEYHLSPSLVLGVIKTESDFNPNARSQRDAYGLMQITKETLEWAVLREGKNHSYTEEDLYTPEINIKYGCYILSLLLDEFEDPKTALAAYNAGRSNVLKWLKDHRYSQDGITLQTTPYKETNDYMEKVLKYQKKYITATGEVL